MMTVIASPSHTERIFGLVEQSGLAELCRETLEKGRTAAAAMVELREAVNTYNQARRKMVKDAEFSPDGLSIVRVWCADCGHLVPGRPGYVYFELKETSKLPNGPYVAPKMIVRVCPYCYADFLKEPVWSGGSATLIPRDGFGPDFLVYPADMDPNGNFSVRRGDDAGKEVLRPDIPVTREPVCIWDKLANELGVPPELQVSCVTNKLGEIQLSIQAREPNAGWWVERSFMPISFKAL